MIDGAPQVMRLTIDLDEHLVLVPAPIRMRTKTNAPLPNLRGECRTESGPPEPHGFAANIDATLEQYILDLPKLQRISDIHRHREADYFG